MLKIALFCYLDLVILKIKSHQMGKNKSISLGSYFENFVNSEVNSGKYSSASEIVRSALRLLESEERKLKELRNALIEGENSPMLENFDAEKHLAELHKKYFDLEISRIDSKKMNNLKTTNKPSIETYPIPPQKNNPHYSH